VGGRAGGDALVKSGDPAGQGPTGGLGCCPCTLCSSRVLCLAPRTPLSAELHVPNVSLGRGLPAPLHGWPADTQGRRKRLLSVSLLWPDALGWEGRRCRAAGGTSLNGKTQVLRWHVVVGGVQTPGR
jgi:hypothetical protein